MQLTLLRTIVSQPSRATVRRLLILIFAASAAVAFGLVLWATPFAIGVESADSIIYIDTARNLLAGKGFQTRGEPLTHYPPMYPFLLASTGIFGTDPLDGARWLQALLLATNSVLIGLLVYLGSRGSLSATACAILLLLSSESILRIHITALSEGAFIVFALATAILLTRFIVRPSDSLLLSVSLVLGSALLSRYVGVTLILPVLISILFFEQRTLRARFHDSLKLCLIAVLPLGLWIIRDVIVAHSATNRALTFHPVNISHVIELITTMNRYWIPIPINDYLKTLLLLLGIAFVVFGFGVRLKDHIRRIRDIDAGLVIQVLSISFIVEYIVFLFLSISFVDAYTHLDSRILSPVYVFSIILVISVASSVIHSRYRHRMWWGFVACFLVLICVHAVGARGSIAQFRENGIGFTSRVWRSSESIEYSKSLPNGLAIYSNGSDLIYFLTGKRAVSIPLRVSPSTLLPNPDFEREIDAIRTKVLENKAVIVYFNNINWRWSLPSREELEDNFLFPILHRLEDGVIYGIRGRGTSPPHG